MRKRYTKCLLLLLLLGLGASASGQGFRLLWVPLDTSEQFLKRQLPVTSTHPDSAGLHEALASGLQRLHEQSFLGASVEALIWRADSSVEARVLLGPSYQWGRLRAGNVPAAFLQRAGYSERAYREKPLRYTRLLDMQNRLLSHLENNGYPFARVWLDSFAMQGAHFEAALMLETGPLIRFGELQIDGDARISNLYLQNYLGIQPGAPYSRQRVLAIPNRIRELPFVEERSPVALRFFPDRADVYLQLEARKASRFDFLLGLLPSTDPLLPRRLLITGTALAELQNALGRGERIFFSFEQFRPGTQELELAFSYPYLLQMPFGVDLGFNQYKRDSTYNDVQFDVGISYLLEGGNYVKGFWNNFQSSLITVDTLRVRQTRQLPETIDLRTTMVGLELQWQRLDYRFNPRRGWWLWARAGGGIKTISPNSQIIELRDPAEPEFNYASLYDSLPARSLVLRGAWRVERFWPIGRIGTVRTALRGGTVYSPAGIFRSESFRIGGNQILRGFDEESIFSSFFALATLEYRLLIGTNSNFFAFADLARVDDRLQGSFRSDWPLGLGAGLNFETRAGIFGLSLAVGSQQGNAIDWRRPKVHLGYVSYF